jgi:CheY-like chemotaxis protein
MKILLVEDHDELREALTMAFEDAGHEVHAVPYLNSALAEVPWCDTVLCDGIFPPALGAFEDVCWPKVARLSEQLGKGFVGFTGDDRQRSKMEEDGYHTIRKSGDIAEILEALQASIEETV